MVETIYKTLREEYKKTMISKKELAKEMGCSVSTIENGMRRGYGIPKYKKIGDSETGTVRFNIIDVAEFLAQSEEVM
jgi:transcriptional regulator with XRE-family HTH domain